MKEHFRKLEKMYLSAPIINSTYPDTQIEISHSQAKITTTITENHFHTGGSLHGSVYFRMLDDAAFFAANSLETEYFLYTVSFNLHLLKPVFVSSITAIGKVITGSKNLYLAESTLFNGQDQIVAHGTGNFMRSKILLSTVDCY
jgi:uncharacterized protein (TIGR00369 family)